VAISENGFVSVIKFPLPDVFTDFEKPSNIKQKLILEAN